MNKKRDRLLKLFELKNRYIREFDQNYQGPGILKKIKRLLKYREKYLSYLIRKIFNFDLIKTQTFFGKNFCYRNDLFTELFGLLSGIQELRLAKFLIKYLPENSVFYDIGAHFGFYSLLTNELLDKKEIHIFEPTPNTFLYLKKNLPNSKNIFLNNFALSNKEGEREFFISKKVELSVANSFDITKDPSLNPSDFKKIKIKATTLDRYCSSHSLPTFLKIDAEGAEGEIIEGGKAILKKANPTLAIEIWDKSKNTISHSKAIEILYSLGYKSYQINEDGKLDLIERLIPSEQSLGFNNFIFKK